MAVAHLDALEGFVGVVRSQHGPIGMDIKRDPDQDDENDGEPKNPAAGRRPDEGGQELKDEKSEEKAQHGIEGPGPGQDENLKEGGEEGEYGDQAALRSQETKRRKDAFFHGREPVSVPILDKKPPGNNRKKGGRGQDRMCRARTSIDPVLTWKVLSPRKRGMGSASRFPKRSELTRRPT